MKTGFPERIEDISVEDLKARLDAADPPVVLDVREVEEYRICNIGGTLLPLGVLPLRIGELDPEREYAVLCHHGNRSRWATAFLLDRGFKNVKNVAGGIDAWAKRIDPSMRRY
jgi:sulfur-carrier protein adenylyltransferase/sulfurtransferase